MHPELGSDKVLVDSRVRSSSEVSLRDITKPGITKYKKI